MAKPQNKAAASDKIVVAENRKARERYIIEDHFEAGMVLIGTEVKSMRDGKAQIADAYAVLQKNEVFLENLHVSAYSHGGYVNHEPTRTRKLLLHRREIEKLRSKLERRGYTLVPLTLYFKNGHAKVDLGLCIGKNSVDRREEIKERTAQREIDRTMKSVKRR